jgi:hypothetical protein
MHAKWRDSDKYFLDNDSCQTPIQAGLNTFPNSESSADSNIHNYICDLTIKMHNIRLYAHRMIIFWI